MRGGTVGGLVAGLILVAAVVLAVLLWAAKRGRPKGDARPGVRTFRYHALARCCSLVYGLGGPLAVTIVAILAPPKDDGEMRALIGLHVLVGAHSLPTMWETLRFAVVMTDEGLECHSPWRGWHFVRWGEVRSLSYSPAYSWFVIHTHSGYRFRVPKLRCVGRFLECLEARLHPADLQKAHAGYALVGRPLPPPVPTAAVDLSRWEVPTADINAVRCDERTRGEDC